MKVINHYKPQHAFDCVIYGTIEVNQIEWQEIKAYLKRQNFIGELWLQKIVRERMETQSKNALNFYGENLYCLGVTPTKRVFEKYKLPRYKHQNYQIKVM